MSPGASQAGDAVHISLLTIYLFPPANIYKILGWKLENIITLKKKKKKNASEWKKNKVMYLFGQASWLLLDTPVSSRCRVEKMDDYLLAYTSVHQLVILNEMCTYRAAISASCSAALMAASSSSLDTALMPFLSFAYHVRSLPFCQRPTGAIKEFPGTIQKSLDWLRKMCFMCYFYIMVQLSLTVTYSGVLMLTDKLKSCSIYTKQRFNAI